MRITSINQVPPPLLQPLGAKATKGSMVKAMNTVQGTGSWLNPSPLSLSRSRCLAVTSKACDFMPRLASSSHLTSLLTGFTFSDGVKRRTGVSVAVDGLYPLRLLVTCLGQWFGGAPRAFFGTLSCGGTGLSVVVCDRSHGVATGDRTAVIGRRIVAVSTSAASTAMSSTSLSTASRRLLLLVLPLLRQPAQLQIRLVPFPLRHRLPRVLQLDAARGASATEASAGFETAVEGWPEHHQAVALRWLDQLVLTGCNGVRTTLGWTGCTNEFWSSCGTEWRLDWLHQSERTWHGQVA